MRRSALTVGLAAALALFVGVPRAAAQSVQLVPFGGQTFSSPFHVTGVPGDPSRVFVVEGAGTIRIVKDGVTQDAPFLDISGDVCSSADGCGGESGLFSMAPAPDYSRSGLFYVFYTRDSAVPGEAHYLRIEEFRRSAVFPDIADPATRRVVLEIPHLETKSHNGGQLQFGRDGLLYISVGDGATGGNPSQSTETLLGKLLRVNPAGTLPGEYSIPTDNPFAGAAPGADEIYSYGLRNPYRFSFDRLTGDLTIGDVGEVNWEEIDFMPSGAGRGANFGWNCFEGSRPFSGSPSSCATPPLNHTPPVLEYPNPGTGLSAVNGGYVLRDGALPSLLGRYIYADTYDVFGGELRTAQLFAGGSSGDSGLGVFATYVVSFGEDACAHIYVAAIEGTVYRLEPTSGPFPCMPPPPVACAGRDATITGTEGADQLSSTPRPDVIAGLGGNDTIIGLAGTDVICGGKGADTLKGGQGNDQLLGGEGNDKLLGQAGNDKLLGQAGNDKLKGKAGKDTLEGGGGRDLCKGGKGKDSASKCEVEKSI